MKRHFEIRSEQGIFFKKNQAKFVFLVFHIAGLLGVPLSGGTHFQNRELRVHF